MVGLLLLLTPTHQTSSNSSQKPLPVQRDVATLAPEIQHLPVVQDKPRVVYKRLDGSKSGHSRVATVLHGQSVGSGQCVSYAQAQGFKISGTARDWLHNATLAGYSIGSTPKVGAIIVTRESSAKAIGPGHVTGDIEKIDGEWTYQCEQNYISHTVSCGWISQNDPMVVGYIYAL